MAGWANARERKMGKCRAKHASSPCSTGSWAGGWVHALLPLQCWGSTSTSSSCCWEHLPPSLLMNVGETCCAMTLISKENCKAFLFLPFPTC